MHNILTMCCSSITLARSAKLQNVIHKRSFHHNLVFILQSNNIFQISVDKVSSDEILLLLSHFPLQFLTLFIYNFSGQSFSYYTWVEITLTVFSSYIQLTRETHYAMNRSLEKYVVTLCTRWTNVNKPYKSYSLLYLKVVNVEVCKVMEKLILHMQLVDFLYTQFSK